MTSFDLTSQTLKIICAKVNELLTLCEDHRDKISVILAGYEDDFQKKFFAYNVGLKSRFKEIIFEDFDEKELSVIWTEARTRKMWKEEEGVCSVATRRLLKKSGKKGFGNARDVRRLLESAVNNALARQDENFSPDDMILEIRDVIGEDPRLKNEKLHRLLGEINEKIGWKRVKERVSELIDLCGRNYHQELMGKPPFEIFLNRMFLGNPGKHFTSYYFIVLCKCKYLLLSPPPLLIVVYTESWYASLTHCVISCFCISGNTSLCGSNSSLTGTGKTTVSFCM